MEEILQITTSADSAETAETIGRRLVDRRLAACAQITGPIKSIYHWKGRVEEAEEWLCAVKTRKSLYGKVEAEIRELHPYELPEIVAVVIGASLPGYREWVLDETEPGPSLI